MSVSSGRRNLLEIEFVLRPGKRREFDRTCDGLSKEKAAGLARFSVYEDAGHGDSMMWISEWTDRGAAEAYLEGDGFRLLMGALSVLGTVTDCRWITGDPDETASGVPGRLDKEPRRYRITPPVAVRKRRP